ncbi:MAG: pirin family protein [Planctomycetota bacterium]|jgi:redox-sensitive bicupin YhaK (pirin superfamily)|nr:pirin family protein [Planctomycetota bacterium]
MPESRKEAKMPHFTNVVKTVPFNILDAADAVRFDYFMLEDFTCPVILFDRLLLKSAGFPPHPHAGLCVFTYLFEDSEGSLRDRDSMPEEIMVEPGGLLWFQMASGMIHEENPAVDGKTVHQFQVWVNLAKDKHGLPPATMQIKSKDVPVAEPESGGKTRVLLGSYRGKTSPLTPTEPFTLLDIALRGGQTITQPSDEWSAMLYCLSGTVDVNIGGGKQARLFPEEVVGIQGHAAITIGSDAAHLIYMAKPLLDQPLVVQGMYAMCSQGEIDAAKRRFHAGGLGEVVPYPEVVHPEEKYVPAGQEPDLAVTPVVLRQATVRHYDEGWWKLHLQYCRYEYNNTETAHGYRFVWEDPDGGERPLRLGGYIPYMEYARQLLDIAKTEGWGDIPYRDSF